MNRMSSLDIAVYCGGASALNAKHGAGRRAAMGTAFHALCSGAEEASELYVRLNPEEQDEISRWHKPVEVTVGDAVLLYEDAEKELEVTLDADGGCAGEPITIGHLDMAWVHGGVAYVADIKATHFTSHHDSLQLMAYGFAFAALRGVDRFCCGIWGATEGTWSWGPMRDIYSAESGAILDRVLAAARNVTDEYSTGPHCSGCYARFHCPEHLLPLSAVGTELEPFAAPGAIYALPDPEKAELLRRCKAAKDTADAVERQLRAWADVNGGIRDGNGKVYLPVLTQGRESCSVKTLREKLGADAEPLITRGREFYSYRWCVEK